MDDLSILIGGAAGDGIKQAGNMIAKLFSRVGKSVFVYEDYQSLIKGGHNFAIIRASNKPIAIHKDKIDILIALNQDTLEKHKGDLVIFDSGSCKYDKGIGIDMSAIAKSNNLPLIVRNVVALGALGKCLGIDFEYVQNVIKSCLKTKTEENIKVSKQGFDLAKSQIKFVIKKANNKPLLSGNEAIALGAVKAGLDFYISYPMTPASSILHFLADHADKLGIKTIHPENEIAAALMAEGGAYAGKRTMVGTSGGGFALMVEALSFAGMAELPVTFVLSQRFSPSTGVPTYTGQGDLNFALNAGHGEFPRIVAAPGDADQAFNLSGELLNLSWQFQIPTILISDKHLSESTFSADIDEKKIKINMPKMWNKTGEYKRYAITSDGISPLAFPGDKDAVIKTTSYEHDEYGIAVEDAASIKKMMDKRLLKQKSILKELKKKKLVKVFGKKNSKIAIIGWGSILGAGKETAEELGIKFIQPLYLEPFPIWQIEKELKGVKKLIDIEMNSTGQLAKLLKANGIECNEIVLKYDGRPFSQDELKGRISKIL